MCVTLLVSVGNRADHHPAMGANVELEGEDKPLKYPMMFRAVDLVLVNKIDLLPHLDYDIDELERNLQAVNPGVRALRISTRTGAGLDAWHDWLGRCLPVAATRVGA